MRQIVFKYHLQTFSFLLGLEVTHLWSLQLFITLSAEGYLIRMMRI